MEVGDKHGHGRGHIHARQLLPQAIPDAAAERIVAPRLHMRCHDLRALSFTEASVNSAMELYPTVANEPSKG